MSVEVEIVGAGPAGLSAALAVAREGEQAVVFEKNHDVGGRFHGDFQGLENWTTKGNVLEELDSLGIQPTWNMTPFRECVFYDSLGKEYVFRSPEPLWYLVKRGKEKDTLDQALKAQALSCGVKIQFGSMSQHLPRGGIVAHGPRRADVIAIGYVFETKQADGAFAVISDQLAPKGYAYLLVCKGRATVASCLFADFHNEKFYVERTVEFFQKKVGMQMANPRPFGGFGNVFPETKIQKGNLLYAGEAAGYQDALFGFGMRYAMLSGYGAGCRLIQQNSEGGQRIYQHRLTSLFKLGVANRFLFEKLGDRGYAKLLKKIGQSKDTRRCLHKYYTSGWFKQFLYSYYFGRLWEKRKLVDDCKENCDCTFCRCYRHSEKDGSGESKNSTIKERKMHWIQP